jgi:hypothetical protein
VSVGSSTNLPHPDAIPPPPSFAHPLFCPSCASSPLRSPSNQAEVRGLIMPRVALLISLKARTPLGAPQSLPTHRSKRESHNDGISLARLLTVIIIDTCPWTPTRLHCHPKRMSPNGQLTLVLLLDPIPLGCFKRAALDTRRPFLACSHTRCRPCHAKACTPL